MEESIVPPNKPYLQHLTSSESLVTTYEETRAGFVALALEKNRRATPLIEEARSLKVAASQATTPASLVDIDGIQGTRDDPDIESDVKGLSWSSNGRNRSAKYNLTVLFLRKNVDLCLFNCS